MVNSIDKLIAHVVQIVRPEKVILFGSFATGNQNVFSDVDLLVIADLAHKKDDLIKQISCLAQEFSLKADVLIHTSREIEKAMREPNSFLNSVIINGKIVYEVNKK